MISLARRDGRPLRIGHRGAPGLAPENTLASFRAALEAGVDLIEFDVVGLADGQLVVAHSRDELDADSPSLDETLRFFADEAPDVGLHLDLKLTRREAQIVEALRRFDLERRSFVSSFYATTAREIARLDDTVRTGITIPRSILGISEEGRGAPVARAGLHVLRRVTPLVVRPLVSFTRASAVVVHHTIVTPTCVRAVHACDAAIVAWTVDDPDELARVDEAGVDAIVTNDLQIFGSFSLSTLET